MKIMPIAALIAGNLIALAGVLYWGWDLRALLVLYWLESLVIGVLNIPKILTAAGSAGHRIRIALFFTFHYGLFWLGHGLFLFVFLMPKIEEVGGAQPPFPYSSVKLAFYVIAASLVLGFVMDLLRTKDRPKLPPIFVMFAPYGRVFVMHILILGGAYAAAQYASVLPVLLLFVALKTIAELGSMVIGKSMRKTMIQP